MKRMLGAAVIGALMLFSSVVVSAEGDGCRKCGSMGGGMGMGMGKGGAMCGMHGDGMGPSLHDLGEQIDRLDLDQNQLAAVKEIRNRSRKEMIKKRADLQVAKVELQELLDRDQVDMKAVEAKFKQMEPLRTALHLQMLREQEEIKAKLTPDQLKRLKAMRDDHGPRMHEGKGSMQH